MTEARGSKPLTVIDLFAGIGGFTLGLEATGGFRTIAMAETDPFCQRVLASLWPEVPNLGDVRNARYPKADVITGGFPCQDVSRVGKGAGLSGGSSGLYREVIRAIRLVRPRYVLLENVVDLLSRGMGTLVGDLAQVGYDAQWDSVSAADLGAPHLRERVWCIACRRPSAGPQPLAHLAAGRHDRIQRAVADAARARLSQRALRQEGGAGLLAASAGSTMGTVWADGWPREPALCDLDGRVPERVDRTRVAGNAAIPQAAYLMGEAVLAMEAIL